jgi:hypothetical protein
LSPPGRDDIEAGVHPLRSFDGAIDTDGGKLGAPAPGKAVSGAFEHLPAQVFREGFRYARLASSSSQQSGSHPAGVVKPASDSA